MYKKLRNIKWIFQIRNRYLNLQKLLRSPVLLFTRYKNRIQHLMNFVKIFVNKIVFNLMYNIANTISFIWFYNNIPCNWHPRFFNQKSNMNQFSLYSNCRPSNTRTQIQIFRNRYLNNLLINHQFANANHKLLWLIPLSPKIWPVVRQFSLFKRQF